MIGINKLSVLLLLEGQETEVGELVLSERKIYFKYHSGFLSSGINISPIKLPYSGEIVSADMEPFEGLYGVFNDSLSDGWGKLLLDRLLSSKGINIAHVTPLDRLAFVGSNGMGALVYKPELETDKNTSHVLELDIIAHEMARCLLKRHIC
jgi:serine/threonine-protein kinase HipA